MDTIVFYNQKGTISIEHIIVNALNNSKNIRCNQLSTNNSLNLSDTKVLNVVFTNNLKNINYKNFILVITNSIKSSDIKYIHRSAHIIVNSCNQKSIKKLAGCKARVYTCGFSNKDYVTFSSRDDNTAMVSLQRNIKLVNKKICEPFEISCQANENCNNYSILATVLALILLEIIDDKRTAVINI